jgi:hypothetical protein
MPSVQNPLAHSPAPSHACPPLFLHVPDAQEYPAAQSEPVEHDVLHAPAEQTYGKQSWMPASWQFPLPSHVWTMLRVVTPAHVAARQTVPPAYSLHPRLPSHTPFRLHEAAPSSGHSPSGSVPSEIAEHTPTPPVRLHLSHVPPHLVLQHTPSVQKPP